MAKSNFALRLFAASALALAMAGCNDNDTRARIDAPEPAPLAELAVISDLPPAAPAPVREYVPERGYPLAERAYGLQRAFHDVPPDYGFAYDDERSYVWETADDWEMYAEPWDDGYRYYYYEPGASYPYFVRDRAYGYGFSSVGVLIAVFDAGGRYLPRDYAYRAAPMAGRYWSRGHELWRARRAAPRIQVDERVWVAQAPRLVRTSDPWLRAAREDRDWRAWRDRDNDRELRRFKPEQRRREASAASWRQRLDRQDDRRVGQADRRDLLDDPRRNPQFDHRALAGQRREAERHTQPGNRAERQPPAQAVQVRQQAERQAAQGRLAERRQQPERAQAQANARVQAERHQQWAQADRAHREQVAQVEQRQRQAAERQQQRVQAVQAERRQREQQQQARQQQAQQEARQHAQARQGQQEARQPQQQARQAQQQAREQARAADQQARNANTREGRPDRGGGRDKAKPDKRD